MLAAALVSLSVVFVAELGDKSQPERFLHGMASVLFLLLGLWLLFDGGLGLRWVAVGVTAAVGVATAAAGAAAFVCNRRENPQALPPLESSPDPGGPPAGYCLSND
jgi:hypothetical protein